MPLICLSEYLHHHKNEYFDLLRTTQYSGGYIRWIKFFVNAVGEIAKCSAELLIQYENNILRDGKQIKESNSFSRNIWCIYSYLQRFPITSIPCAVEQTGFSYNSISKAFRILIQNDTIVQDSNVGRNRTFKYARLLDCILYNISHS